MEREIPQQARPEHSRALRELWRTLLTPDAEELARAPKVLAQRQQLKQLQGGK